MSGTEPDRGQIAERFRRSLATYDEEASIQREVGVLLLDLLEDVPDLRYRRVLEIGCGTGLMTGELCRRQEVDQLYLNDLVDEFCQSAAERVAAGVGQVCSLAGDIESRQLPSDLDLIISSSTFQWLADLPAMFAKCATALDSGAYLAFALFGPGTMAEIRHLTGVGLDYWDEEQLRAALAPHFRTMTVKHRSRRLYFTRVRDILRHIQRTGVSGVRRYRWTPRTLRQFEATYEKLNRTSEGLPLSYEAIAIIAQKKD